MSTTFAGLSADEVHTCCNSFGDVVGVTDHLDECNWSAAVLAGWIDHTYVHNWDSCFVEFIHYDLRWYTNRADKERGLFFDDDIN